MKNQQGFMKVLLIFIALAAVGVGGYYLVNRNKPAQGTVGQNIQPELKKYANPKARFVFNYPSKWKIIKEYVPSVSRTNGFSSRIAHIIFNIVKAQGFSPDWEEGGGYYETPAGVRSVLYSVWLAPVGYNPFSEVQIQNLDSVQNPIPGNSNGNNSNVSDPFKSEDPSAYKSAPRALESARPFIYINERQFSCHAEEWWDETNKRFIDFVFVDSPNFRWLPPFKSYKTLEGETKTTGTSYIATCSKEQYVLDALDEIAKSFVPFNPFE